MLPLVVLLDPNTLQAPWLLLLPGCSLGWPHPPGLLSIYTLGLYYVGFSHNDKGERGEWKRCLKLNIQKTEIMTSGPITLWKIEGEKVEVVTAFIFSGSQITVDGGCSEIKRCLLLGKLWQTKQHIKRQSRHFLDKGLIVKALICPVVMYTCESWTVKKSECRRTDAFKLWCWRRVLRVP